MVKQIKTNHHFTHLKENEREKKSCKTKFRIKIKKINKNTDFAYIERKKKRKER